MFEKVLVYTFFWLPIAFMMGYFFRRVVYKHTKGGLRTAFNVLNFIGTIIHESAHAILCFIIGVPIKGVEVHYRDEMTGIIVPHGSVAPKRFHKVSFIQSFLVGLAPLLVGVIVFFFSLDVAVDMSAALLHRIIAALVCVSLFFGVKPSGADLARIKESFENNPAKSCFQIILLFLSFGMVWLMVDSFAIDFPFEFMYYILMGFVFIVLKYFCLLWYTIYHHARKNREGKKSGSIIW